MIHNEILRYIKLHLEIERFKFGGETQLSYHALLVLMYG